MLKISSGVVPRAQKVVLYGVEGIGKTTLAAQAPEPLFIDTEGGTAHMDVRRLTPENWAELLSVVDEVAATPGVCGTLVIDTADWAEAMAIDHICRKYRQPGLEAFGYGKGYTYLGEEFARLLAACDRVIASGAHVIITAHAKQRKIELPDETGSFDSWGMKLSKQCGPLLKEWPDDLLFLNYKTYVITTEDKKHKAQGGKRVITTCHRPTVDAKNRHGLPDEMDMCWESLAPIFEGTPVRAPEAPVSAPAPEAPAHRADPMAAVSSGTLAALKAKLDEAGIDGIYLRKLVAAKGKFAEDVPIEQYPEGFVTEWVLKNWEQIVQAIISDPKFLPF